MTIRVSKPWIELSSIDDQDLPAQLGVFQLADVDGHVLYIGHAGGRDAFGLRTAIGAARSEVQSAVRLRFELTHGYMSRWEELMMIHHFDHGAFPPANDETRAPRGRLNPVARGPEDA